ncbi:single-stranded-DNA-specific exonuclease RecJ [Thiomicrorhabdus heinhorstiae]|uniref:Single-stranded-DNA-specific exonuclease RecJ n=1 Tax=Thiomicrorhabdus heinhorstiae TaxID=2748010 RepID=A0ABS0BXQ6_9GAMM|nr:DHH family phosphoesterase [Thiomicrorhabdus heinhorstiae]MBF6056852.1 DHH family phosphoesterase [Thiomicrorhabdus heinhorstiae]
MIKPTQILERQPNPATFDAAKGLGLTDLQAMLVANRLQNPQQLDEIVFPKLKHIQPPLELKNADFAAKLIADAVQSGQTIVLATDYDTDGVTSAWVATTALSDFFGVNPQRIRHIIGERKSGYGITDEVVDRILAIEEPVALVISADQGSSDEARIARLKEAGIPVCVTDHHQLPIEGPPPSAVCTVNPQQSGCDYDKTVAGCFVIFLVMAQVRQELISRGYLSAQTPSLKPLALNVSLGTVADSVSLKSPNNRAIVRTGLQMINRFQSPAWQAMKELNDNQGQPFDAEFLGFQVATRINAASRVSDVTTAFHFLTAHDLSQAKSYLQQLDEDNLNRREQQNEMLLQAKERARELYHPNKYSLAVKLQGNAGIQGIIASRIGEQYGVPTVAMTDLEDGFLAGSGRGIVDEVDLRAAFQWMSEQDSELFSSMGGHKGAAGCMIPIEKYPLFSELFETAIQAQLGTTAPSPRVFTDGQLHPSQLTPPLIQEINALEPFGREWPKPLFKGIFRISSIKSVGQTQTHLSLKLSSDQGTEHSAIFFNGKESAHDQDPFSSGDWIECAYQPALNRFFGRTNIQLRIQAAHKL